MNDFVFDNKGTVHKLIIDAIEKRLDSIDETVEVLVNAPIPEEIPENGLIIIRDGKPKPTTEMLGGFDTVQMQVVVPVEIFVADGDDRKRDFKYDALAAAVQNQLYIRDPVTLIRSLGITRDTTDGAGMVYGVIIDRVKPDVEGIPGSAAIKSSTLGVNVTYEAQGPLA